MKWAFPEHKAGLYEYKLCRRYKPDLGDGKRGQEMTVFLEPEKLFFSYRIRQEVSILCPIFFVFTIPLQFLFTKPKFLFLSHIHLQRFAVLFDK